MTESAIQEMHEAARLGLINYAYCRGRAVPVPDAQTALDWVWDLDRRHIPLSATFDPAVYMEAYPDIRANPIHPVIHYLRNGRAEGRTAFPVFDAALPAMAAAKRPVWIESHDLSFTGAPIALHHLLQGWPELARNALVGAPGAGPIQTRLQALGCTVVPHGQGARRAHAAADAPVLTARCRTALTHSGVGGVLGNSVLAWPMVMAALDLGLPTAWTIHEPNADEVADLFEPALFVQVRAAMGEVDQLIFVSQDSRRAWGADGFEHAQVIEKALPPQTPGHRDTGRQAANCGPQDILILSVGSISARKGQADLIGALELLAETRAAARLVSVFIGYTPSPYAEDVRQRLAALRQKGLRAFLLPESRTDKDRRTVEHLFAAADIFIMSSRAESLPLTTAEALAAGCPVISTDIAGIAEMVTHGQTGLLYAAGDSETLAQHIRHLAQTPELRAQMRSTIAARSNPQAYPDMIAAYRKALAEVTATPALANSPAATGKTSSR